MLSWSYVVLSIVVLFVIILNFQLLPTHSIIGGISSHLSSLHPNPFSPLTVFPVYTLNTTDEIALPRLVPSLICTVLLRFRQSSQTAVSLYKVVYRAAFLFCDYNDCLFRATSVVRGGTLIRRTEQTPIRAWAVRPRNTAFYPSSASAHYTHNSPGVVAAYALINRY